MSGVRSGSLSGRETGAAGSAAVSGSAGWASPSAVAQRIRRTPRRRPDRAAPTVPGAEREPARLLPGGAGSGSVQGDAGAAGGATGAAARDTITTDGDVPVGAPTFGAGTGISSVRTSGATGAATCRASATLVRCGLGDDRQRCGLPRPARLGARHPGGAPPRCVADLDAARRRRRLRSRRGGSGLRDLGRVRHRNAVLAGHGRDEQLRAGQLVRRVGPAADQVGDRPGTFAAGLRCARRGARAAQEEHTDVCRRGEQDDDQPDQDHGGHRPFISLPHPGRCEHAHPTCSPGRKRPTGCPGSASGRRGPSR